MNKRRKLSKLNVKKHHLAYGAITLVALFSCILAVMVIFKSSQVTTESLSKADKVRVAKKSKMTKATSKSKVEDVKQAPKPSQASNEAPKSSSQSTEANSQQQVTASEEAAVEQAVVTENTPATSQAQQAYAVTETTYRPAQHQTSGQVLSNGNTAGAMAQQLQHKWLLQQESLSLLGNILLPVNQMVILMLLMPQELQDFSKRCQVGVQQLQFRIKLIQLLKLIVLKVYQLGVTSE